MSTSKLLLTTQLIDYLSDVSATATVQQKAEQLAGIIDDYVTDVVTKITGSSTVTGTCSGVTGVGPPTGPYPIVAQPVTGAGAITPGGLIVN
jgi:hypothetical protein